MKIQHCKINHLVNPIGFDLQNPKVTWIVESEDSKKQIAAQVRVALDDEFNKIVFNTEKSTELSNLGVTLPITLEHCTRYFWTVTVWGDKGDVATSDINWFETGKVNQKWVAQPIKPSWEDCHLHPYFRYDFELKKEVKQARLYISGQGLYHAELNGKKIGEEY